VIHLLFKFQHAQVITTIILNSLLTNEVDKAKQLHDTYVIRESDNFLISYLFGMHYKNLKDYAIAEEFLIQATKQLPCHLSFQALGECCSNLNRLGQAEENFKKAIKCKFDDQESWRGLKETFRKQERNEAAKLCDLIL
jgi:tetratricopeptide (TPR) repeat protein